MSAPYSARIVLETDIRADQVADLVLGRSATLGFGSGPRLREVGGIVQGVHTCPSAHGSKRLVRDNEVELVVTPVLSLLRGRKTSRVFQDSSVVQIVSAVLTEWQIEHRWALSSPRSAWDYCVQHQESDLDFIERVLAAEGIFYFFEPGRSRLGDDGDGMSVVFGDSTAAYAIGSDATGERRLSLLEAPRHQPGAHGDRMFEFGERRSLQTATVMQREYNPGRAGTDTSAQASATRGPKADTFSRPLLRSSYEYMPPRPLDVHARGAVVALEQQRREASTYDGECAAPRLAVGQIFDLDSAGTGSLEGAYAVIALETYGHDPRYFHDDSAADETLRQKLRAVRADEVYRPAPAKRALHHGLDTAVVVGPLGAPLATDSLGRVRVRFHWDDDRPGLADDGREWNQRSSWLRVAQAWNGGGAGAFFLPRVGSEVLVGYLGGDLNRPIIIGSLPNSANPPPFSLPIDAGKSGIVTRGLSDDVRSELVFDDTGGRESARLASQRRLELSGLQDVDVSAGRDQTTKVRNDSSLDVGGARRETVSGDRTVSVAGTSALEAGENLAVRVAGHTSASLESLSLHVRSDATATFTGPLECAAMSDVRLDVEGITALRHEGTLFVGVGTPDKPAAHLLHVTGASTHEAGGPIELVSDREIVLRVGASTLRISPEAIQLETPRFRVDAPSLELVGEALQIDAEKFVRIQGDKVFVLSSSASLALTTIAKLNGTAIKLGAPPDANDGPEAKKPGGPPTRIRLVDDQGMPIAGERCEVHLSDGSSRAAVTNVQGIATLFDLTGSAEVDFIDLPQWKAG